MCDVSRLHHQHHHNSYFTLQENQVAIDKLFITDLCICSPHRFGNGLFACLILGLSLAQLVAVMVGSLGSLVLELQDLTWTGTELGCLIYYFSSSWLVRCLVKQPVMINNVQCDTFQPW